jgi:hypothetical protein
MLHLLADNIIVATHDTGVEKLPKNILRCSTDISTSPDTTFGFLASGFISRLSAPEFSNFCYFFKIGLILLPLNYRESICVLFFGISPLQFFTGSQTPKIHKNAIFQL